MSEKPKGGGPAFPCPDVTWDSTDANLKGTQGDPGMPLRDWLAGQYTPPADDVVSMCEILFKTMPAGCGNWPMLCKREARAHLRYYEADAMLAEREKAKE